MRWLSDLLFVVICSVGLSFVMIVVTMFMQAIEETKGRNK